MRILESGLDKPKRLIFASEGYEETEREAFLDDVRRLVREVITDPSAPFFFAKKYLGVDAVWVASRQSGIPFGRYDSPKNTAFGLYRDSRAPLRVVEPSSWSYKAARAKAGGEDDEAVVVLLANDDFYGGLGDEVVIATRSLTSGALALRHELGHVLGDLGEEYDGGEDFSGDNFAVRPIPCGVSSRSPRIVHLDGVDRRMWDCAHWLGNDFKSLPSSSQLAVAEWPFSPPPFSWKFDTNLTTATIDLSVAGGLDIVVFLDGRLVLAFAPASRDRSFATVTVENLERRTRHVVQINATKHLPSHFWPPPILCHLQIRLDEQRDTPPFATFDSHGKIVGYRPTYRGCLMRDVTLSCFCRVCRRAILDRLLDFALRNNYQSLEGTWRRDGVLSQKPPTPSRLIPSPTGCWQLTVDTPDLSKSIRLEHPSCVSRHKGNYTLEILSVVLFVCLCVRPWAQKRRKTSRLRVDASPMRTRRRRV